jgi:pimeloyl-ACP methyl ester carboxylesterase
VASVGRAAGADPELDAQGLGGHMTRDAQPTVRPDEDGVVGLPDGRRLGFAVWGMPDGVPVLLVGTSPGSRLLCPDGPATAAAGVRLVTVDRPGYGHSDPKDDPTMTGWAADAGALADHLGLDRFAVVGWSGGGQFALAVAAGLANRVTSVTLAATPAPANDERLPWVPEAIRQVVRLVRQDPAAAAEAVVAGNQWYLEAPERTVEEWTARDGDSVANQPQVAEALAVMLREGARQGAAGIVHDVIAGSLDWGFSLAEVAAPVALWYGDRDPRITPEHGTWYAERLPAPGPVRVRPTDHLLAIPLWAEILAEIRSTVG